MNWTKPAFLCLITVAIIQAFFFTNSIFGLLVFALLSVAFGSLLGHKYFGDQNYTTQIFWGWIVYITATALPLVVLFYFYQIPPIFYNLAFTFSTIGCLFLCRKNLVFKIPQIPHNLSLETIVTNAIFAISIITTWHYLLQASTTGYLASVWLVLGWKFWLAFITSIIFLILGSKFTNDIFNTIKLALLYFTALIIGVVIYRVGFGYDTFIHQATEKMLLESGTISPKPLLYIGHYVLINLLSKVTHFNFELIDKFLPALIISFAVSTGIYNYIKQKLSFEPTLGVIASLIFLIIPFSLIVTATPQGLSLGLSLGLIFLLLSFEKLKSFVIPISIITVFICLTHPLSAVPLLIYLAFRIISEFDLNKYLNLIVLIGSSLAFPLLFIVANNLTTNTVKIDFTLPDLKSLLFVDFSRQYNFLLDFVYLFGNLLYPTLLIVLAFALYKILKDKSTELKPLAYTLLALFLNILITSSVLSFESLGRNEKLFFIERIIAIFFWLSIPLALWQLSSIKKEVKVIEKLFLITVGIFFICASIYKSYPRYDYYQTSKLFNVTQNTLDVVAAAGSEHDKYIVLADQMTAAAAIKLFGFDHNISTRDGQNYFYPVPTGGTLYKLYEELLYGTNTKESLSKIREYTFNKEVKLILNKRFSNSQKINEKIKKYSAFSQEIGEYYLYEF